MMRNPIETCPNCGASVWFYDELWNECDNCHRWYNGAGQEMQSPEAFDRGNDEGELSTDGYLNYDPEEVPYSDGMW